MSKNSSKKNTPVPSSLRWIGKLIQQRREENGFTQESFAEEIGVSAAMIRSIEISKRLPSLRMLDTVCRKLNLRIKIEQGSSK